MPITPEETTAAIEAIEAGTPITEIPALSSLGGAIVIRTTQQDSDYREGILEAGVEEKIKPRISEIHSQYDKDIEEITGLKRPQDKKSYEHMKEVLIQQRTKATELQTSLEALKTAGGDAGKLEEEHKKQLSELEKGFQTRLDEKEKEISDFKAKTESSKHDNSIRSVISTVEERLIAKDKLPPLFNKTLSFIKEYVIKNSRIEEDGTAIMLNENGTDARDTSMRKITVENYLNGELKDVLQKTDPAGGTGGNPPQSPGNPNEPEEFKKIADIVSIPDTIKTKMSLSNYIEKDLKIGAKDPRFGLISKKFGSDLPLR